MPRQRMIRPDFYDSGSLAEVSLAARYLFIALWVIADDAGNIKLQPRKIRKQIFPYDDEITDAWLLERLIELEAVHCIAGYEVGGEMYISVPNFAIYQTVNRPSKSTIPEPEKGKTRALTEYARALTEHSLNTQEHSVNSGNSVSTHGAFSEYSVSTHAKERKKEGKKNNLPYLKDYSSSQVKGSGDGGAGAEKAAPPTAATEDVFEWVDQQFPDPQGYEPKDMEAYLTELNAENQAAHECTTCPPELLEKIKGGAA